MAKCKPGFKREKGRCIKNKSFKRKSKSYNPFKMWGSYVGAVIFLILFFMILTSGIEFGVFTGNCYTSGTDIFTGEAMVRWKDCGLSDYIKFGFGIILVALPGFLIGWGIHSLFRFIKQRN